MSNRATAAARLDEAIDRLLAERGHARLLDADPLLVTARLLRDSLPRFHPRFGFEELLVRRLVEPRPAAAATARQTAEAPGEPARLPLATTLAHNPDAARHLRRVLLAGSAIASGMSLAIPIAGAALLAWRRGRAPAGIT